jgi:hypothetical protein
MGLLSRRRADGTSPTQYLAEGDRDGKGRVQETGVEIRATAGWVGVEKSDFSGGRTSTDTLVCHANGCLAYPVSPQPAHSRAAPAPAPAGVAIRSHLSISIFRAAR